MSQPIAYRRCLLCGWFLPIRRTGDHARRQGVEPETLVLGAPLGHLDPETTDLIQLREQRGGGERGFHAVAHLSLQAAAEDPAYRDYAVAVVAWARRVVALGERLGL